VHIVMTHCRHSGVSVPARQLARQPFELHSAIAALQPAHAAESPKPSRQGVEQDASSGSKAQGVTQSTTAASNYAHLARKCDRGAARVVPFAMRAQSTPRRGQQRSIGWKMRKVWAQRQISGPRCVLLQHVRRTIRRGQLSERRHSARSNAGLASHLVSIGTRIRQDKHPALALAISRLCKRERMIVRHRWSGPR
jgi:hypothetical protein